MNVNIFPNPWQPSGSGQACTCIGWSVKNSLHQAILGDWTVHVQDVSLGDTYGSIDMSPNQWSPDKAVFGNLASITTINNQSNHRGALLHSRSQFRSIPSLLQHLNEETLPFTNSLMPDWRCSKNHPEAMHCCTMQLWPLSLTASTWTCHIMAWHNHKGSPRCNGLRRDAKKLSNLWPWFSFQELYSYTHHIIRCCAVALRTSDDIQPPSSACPTHTKKHFKVNLLTV